MSDTLKCVCASSPSIFVIFLPILLQELQWKLIESKQVGKVKDKTSSSDKGAKLKKLRQTNFKWQLGRKLGGSI